MSEARAFRRAGGWEIRTRFDRFHPAESLECEKGTHPHRSGVDGAKEATGVLLGPAAIGIVVFPAAPSPWRNRALIPTIVPPGCWSDTSVRAAAARDLGRCGNADTIPKLQNAVNDGHASVRYMAGFP